MLFVLFLDVLIMGLMTGIFSKQTFVMMALLDSLKIIVLVYSPLSRLDGVYLRRSSLRLILWIILS